jgi:hypothetical protein
LSASAGKPSGPALPPGMVRAETARLAKRLQSLHRHLAGLELAIRRFDVLEGRMQHVSADVNAAELRDGILELRDSLPSLVRDTARWLSSYGITFEG